MKSRILVSAAAFAVVVTLFADSSPIANAAPTPKPAPSPTTAAQAKDRLKALEAEAADIGEQYATASDALDDGKQRLKVLIADIGIQQKKVDQLSAAAQTIALAQFRNREFDTTVQIFTSSDPDNLLDRLATASRVDETMTKTLSEQQAAQATLEEMKRTAEAEVAALADQEKQLADMKKRADEKVREADALYDSLSGTDREEIDNEDGDPGDSDPGDYADADARIKKAIAYALSKVGKSRYVWGASGPSSFDCSGLMLAAYRQVGISLPHSSAAQAGRGHSVSKSKLRPGDLVFFAHGGRIYHVAMYIGGGKIVHARQPRYGIQVNTLRSYSPVVSARRILG